MIRLDTATDKQAAIAALIEDGSIEECPCCGGLSAYAWCDVDEGLGVEHIPTSSCFEWECGHCGAHLVLADSPINADCYTHAAD